MLGSGKFCTFVATYVAIEYPPAVTYSTSVYLLPTRLYGVVVKTSSTESIMLVDPSQKKVAIMASPWCGFVGLKPLMRIRPRCANVPLALFMVMPRGEYENSGGDMGVTASVHAATAKTATTTHGRPFIPLAFTASPSIKRRLPLLVERDTIATR